MTNTRPQRLPSIAPPGALLKRAFEKTKRLKLKKKKTLPPAALVESVEKEWKLIDNFPDYEISDDGFLRRVTAGSNTKIGAAIRPTIGQTGYPQYGLTSRDGKRHYVTAHKLVAASFLEAPKPYQILVLHANDNKLDARKNNLRWGTSKDNANDAMANGRLALGERHPSSAQPWTRPRGQTHSAAKLTDEDISEIIASPASQKTLAEHFQVDGALIGRIQKGEVWKHLTNPHYAAFLIEGATTEMPPRRQRLTTKMRFALLKSENYRCHLCRGMIYPGQGWDVSHVVPLELGGADDETNRKPAHRNCHRAHTAAVDLPAISKAKRLEATHIGATVTLRPLPGGRMDTLKRKLNGTTVIRATGLPWRPQ